MNSLGTFFSLFYISFFYIDAKCIITFKLKIIIISYNNTLTPRRASGGARDGNRQEKKSLSNFDGFIITPEKIVQFHTLFLNLFIYFPSILTTVRFPRRFFTDFGPHSRLVYGTPSNLKFPQTRKVYLSFIY